MDNIITAARELLDAATAMLMAGTALVAAATALYVKLRVEYRQFKKVLDTKGLETALKTTAMTEAKAKKKLKATDRVV